MPNEYAPIRATQPIFRPDAFISTHTATPIINAGLLGINVQMPNRTPWSGGLRTYVCSRTLRPADYPEVTVVADGAADVVAALRAEPGEKDVWLGGGASLFRSLVAAGVVDTVEVVYARFKNTLVQEPQVRPILPLTNVAEFQAILNPPQGAADTRDMLFEPSAQSVLDALLPFYVNRYIYQVVLSSKASEHSARMVAMKTAKDNATKLVGELSLEYNKARQAAITQEILEIAAASFAST